MTNLNLNVQVFPFFDSVKNPLSENRTSDSFKNNGYDNMTLEISGTGSGTIVVQGCVNTLDANGNQKADADCSWVNLAALSASNLQKIESITEKGIYFIGVGGISRIRVNVTNISGTITIVGALK